MVNETISFCLPIQEMKAAVTLLKINIISLFSYQNCPPFGHEVFNA